MLVFNGEGGGGTVVVNGVVGCVCVKNVVLHDRLEHYTKVQIYHSTIFQVREIFSIYRPTISFYEDHQPVHCWYPATTIKITILKMRYND